MNHEVEVNMARGGNIIYGKDGKSAYQAACEGGYQGTEEEFNKLLALGYKRPTETDTFNTYIDADGCAVTFGFADANETLPIGTEIAQVKVLVSTQSGEELVDIRDSIAYDGVAGCRTHVYKVFLHPNINLVSAAVLVDDSYSSALLIAAQNNQIPKMEITYYTDSVVNEDE